MSLPLHEFSVPIARECANRMISEAKEIQRVYTRLQSALNSVSWWKGDSKDGFVKRGEALLQSVNTTAANALILGNDLLEIAKKKEEEERDLKNALGKISAGVIAAAVLEGGSKA